MATKDIVGGGFMLAVFAGLIGHHLWNNYQLNKSWDWPTVEGKVDTGWIGRENDALQLCVSFRYYVAGEPYAGVHEESASSEIHALSKINRMKDSTIIVRYNPKSPEEHFTDGTGV